MDTLTIKPAKSFQDLKVWQSAYELTLEVYQLCETFPRQEQYGLSSQMTRAAVSVCSNIAEGFGRQTAKDKGQFYAMANGSLTELENQLLIAQGIGYLPKEKLRTLAEECTTTHRMLNALQKVNRVSQ